MRRTASDNVYLHKDFHGALSRGLDYLREHYGEDAVRQYLHEFTLRYYAPLRQEILSRGLDALEDHFRAMYEREGGSFRIRRTPDELVLEVDACPAVTHMRSAGYTVSPLFVETTRTVNETLCEGSPFAAELRSYREDNGASVQRFFRRGEGT